MAEEPDRTGVRSTVPPGRRNLAAGAALSGLVLLGWIALFLAFAATFCIENCPDRPSAKGIFAMFAAIGGLIAVASGPFVASRMSGHRHWFVAGVLSIAAFFGVIVVSAPLPVGFGNTVALLVAAFGAASCVALRPPGGIALVTRFVLVGILLAILIPEPRELSRGGELVLCTPALLGLSDWITGSFRFGRPRR